MSIENGVSKRPHSSGVLLLRSENKTVATVETKLKPNFIRTVYQ